MTDEKEIQKGRFPRIQILNQTNNIVDFEIQKQKRHFKSSVDRLSHWKSYNNVRQNGRRMDRNQDGWRKRSESLTSEHYGRFTSPLRRHHSESFLEKQSEDFAINARALKLNQRQPNITKQRSFERDRFFLPSVFTDTRISGDNLSDLKRSKHNESKRVFREDGDESSTRNIPADKHDESRRRDKGNKPLSIANGTGIISTVNSEQKRKPILLKRRLSEQIESPYEINRIHNKEFPRRITIRTSKSCPTIVIHECGDNAEVEQNRTETRLHEKPDEINVNENEDELTVVAARSVRCLSSWKPSQSIVSDT